MTDTVGDDGLVCLIDGTRADSLTVSDSAVIRGDGCFEAIRSYRGRLFRPDDHLDRLARSAAALGLDLPSVESLNRWMAEVASGRGDCVVRIILTRGQVFGNGDAKTRCLVMSHPLPPPVSELRLMTVSAPWHPGGRSWDLAGVKTISYAPNMAASRTARVAGYDDALLMSDSGTVLEGPTFSIGWVKGGSVFTPHLDLGILESITRRVVAELTPSIQEVRASIDDVTNADEVFVMSTIKEITPVVAIDAFAFAPGPATAALAQRFGFVRAEAGRSH